MSDNASVEFRVRNIPDDDYWKFKALCALEKKNVNAKLLELIHQAVEKSKLG